MPISTQALPAEGSTESVTTASKVLLFGPDGASPLINVPVNAKTWVFQNLDATNFVLLKFSTSTIVGNLSAADSIRLNAGTALTMDVLDLGVKGNPNITTYYLYAQADTADVSMNVILMAVNGSYTRS
jgi:hypothetical protein